MRPREEHRDRAVRRSIGSAGRGGQSGHRSPRSSRCKGSSLSVPGACQDARQQINIWFPPCFLPIPMGDTYTWQSLIRAPSVSTPLLLRFFDIRSAGTPAPRVEPTSATYREVTGGLKEKDVLCEERVHLSITIAQVINERF